MPSPSPYIVPAELAGWRELAVFDLALGGEALPNPAVFTTGGTVVRLALILYALGDTAGGMDGGVFGFGLTNINDTPVREQGTIGTDGQTTAAAIRALPSRYPDEVAVHWNVDRPAPGAAFPTVRLLGFYGLDGAGSIGLAHVGAGALRFRRSVRPS